MSTNHVHVDLNYQVSKYVPGGLAALDGLIQGGMYCVELDGDDGDVADGPYFLEVDAMGGGHVTQTMRSVLVTGWQVRVSKDAGSTWGDWGAIAVDSDGSGMFEL